MVTKRKPQRKDRRYALLKDPSEIRSDFERDHDRVIYSSALRRLAGVTQVVNPSEGQIFHNRLTHSLKVAQIGRRLAERLLKKNSSQSLIPLGGLDSSVVEAAALAHDLGNPPFGHIAETELDRIVRDDYKIPDGFEGNAQSFRIVNKLCFGYTNIPGLNLTRATLNAILKYPWMYKRTKKFGAYETEREEFEFARELVPTLGEIKTLEASLMDLADDITYAVHDLEDFFRANLIPSGDQIWKELSSDRLCQIVESTKETWWPIDKDKDEIAAIVIQFLNLFTGMPLKTPFRGSMDERASIRGITSSLIAHFIHSVEINNDLGYFPSPIILTKQAGVEIIILKHITRHFVISHPSLIRQQYGETQIIRNLFKHFFEAADSAGNWQKIFPMIGQERLLRLNKTANPAAEKVRIVVDTIANLSDNEAIRVFMKLNGIAPGSIFDNLIV